MDRHHRSSACADSQPFAHFCSDRHWFVGPVLEISGDFELVVLPVASDRLEAYVAKSSDVLCPARICPSDGEAFLESAYSPAHSRKLLQHDFGGHTISEISHSKSST